MTIEQAARVGHCSVWVIHRLVKEGKLAAERKGRLWNVTTPRQEIRPLVVKESPKSGYHKNGQKPAPARVPEIRSELLAWLGLSKTARTRLLAIAARFSEDELELLTDL